MQNISVKVLALPLIAFSLFFQACQPVTQTTNQLANQSAEPHGPGQRGGRLVHRISAPLKTFNYLMADDEPSVTATVYLLGSRLAAFDHSTQQFAPALAESWTTAPDGVTVNIKLRSGLKFSDGQPLTADDVIFTLESAYDKRTNSPVFRDSLLVNGKEIQTKKISDTELQFILPEKVAGLENYLDNLVVLPKHILSKDRDAGTLSEAWKIDADPGSVVTSGPFMVESSTPGTRVVFKRNPHYWRTDSAGTQLPYLDNLTLEIVPDANNAFSRLGQQEIDIFDRIRASDYVSLKDASGAVRAIDLGPGQSNDHIWFNQNKAKKGGERLDDKPKYTWFTDRRFRKAISHAVDRDSIAKTTLQGLASPLHGFVPVGNKVWLDPNLPKTGFDLERSKSLLTEAGFVRRGTDDAPELFDAKGNAVEFTLIVQATNEERKLEAAVIQQDIAKLGIKMQIATLDTTGVMLRAADTLDYEAILFGLTLTGIEPSGFANFLLSTASSHQWHPSQKTPATEWEARVDKLFAEQATEVDVAKRKQLMFEIQGIFTEEVPIIPIVSRHIVSAANIRIGNHAPSTVLPYSLWNSEELFVKQ
jgi:peptide/nickel transport system substrate-binding protein